MHRMTVASFILIAGLSQAFLPMSHAHASAGVVLIIPEDASPLETLAVHEARRVVYQRTGDLLPIGHRMVAGNAIIVANAAHISGLVPENAQFAGLKENQYVLKTIRSSTGLSQIYLIGGCDTTTLYAVYRFAEHMGVRFYLDGDVFPDQRIPLRFPGLDEIGEPLFELRGIQPFHDFPEGPDWWNLDDYQAIIGQLPKLRMNFIGLHTYPLVEPTVWIGRPEDCAADGSVQFSYPTRYFNTGLTVGWGFDAKPTSAYACGASALFDRDIYTTNILNDLTPMPKTQEENNAVFNRTGSLFHDAFTTARNLGIKTCIGTETPLVIPPEVAQRMGGNPAAGLVPDGGQSAKYSAAIEATEDGPLYQSVRFNLKGYRCGVPNGLYSVTLRFCEVAYDQPRMRIFGVTLEDKTVIDGLDIFAKVGKNRPLDFSFNDIQVADGCLDIGFTPQVEFPAIAAIEVTGNGQSWKVNCGGAAYNDYLGEDSGALTSEQIQKIYEGIFTRITRTHPLDYYWFWTPETWTWEGVTQEVVDRTLNDLRIAQNAWQQVKPPFELATCGWVLGPQYNRSLMGEALPPNFSVSCINRQVGHEAVESAFAKVKDRGKWAIPWLEDDPAMTSMQLWAGRMRRDARDALAYGCNGLMGIHWRTRILRPNVAALAQAAWEQDDWKDPMTLQSGVMGGNVTQFPENVILNTSQQPLYQDVRWDVSSYRVIVPNGQYTVVLQFVEPFYDAPGKRVFGVKIEGQSFVDDLDIFERVGKNKALDLTFDPVVVMDGRLDIEFVKKTEYPVIAAFSINGPDTVVKINCGGNAWEEYSADLPDLPPHPYALDFYRDWAFSEFGPYIAKDAAEIFTTMDGRLPRPSDWIGGPGGYAPDKKPWAEVSKNYEFVDQFAALRPRINSKGDQERFDYWLNNMEFLRATGHMRCLWNEYNQAFESISQLNDPALKAQHARENALPQWIALIRCVEEAYAYLLATVDTAGEMGTVCNFEQHTFPKMIDQPAAALAAALGEPLPEEAQLRHTYDGPARLIVPTKRTLLNPGEDFNIRVIVLDDAPAQKVVFYWRKLGQKSFRQIVLEPQRQTYFGLISSEDIQTADFEYYIEAQTGSGDALCWPPTAPELNQVVVVAAISSPI